MKYGYTGMATVFAMWATLHPVHSPAQSPQAASSQTSPSSPPAQSKGQVVFSRSIDQDGNVSSQAGTVKPPPEIQNVDAPVVDDANRRAVTFTSLDLDVHLRSAEQRIAARALLTVRNDGKTPLERIPLQISSSLYWERIRVNGRDAAFTVATLNSDTDHTGQLHEAAVPLAAPLAPGAGIALDVTYSGTVPADARRLLAIGTPDETALLSDWDQIGVDFTGLRGFGNVVWYPVSSVPAMLGDGARVFDEIGLHKRRLSGARFRLHLAVEYPADQAPTMALINGHSVPLTATAGSATGEVDGVATAELGPISLGFEAPSLFVAIRTRHAGPHMDLWALAGNSGTASSWTTAAGTVAPFLEGWLGKRPAAQLTVLDLPDPQDAPFETGSMLAVPVRQAPSDTLESALVHAMAHAFLHSGAAPPEWLDEGGATFMETLWTERQRGREKALETLESSRQALALTEPGSPGQNAGQPLASAISPVYYRTKAAYVLWMLRDIAGDTALSAALRAYAQQSNTGGAKRNEPEVSLPAQVAAPGANNSGASTGSLATAAAQLRRDEATVPRGSENRPEFEQLLEQADQRDLSWFFSDWVDADHGLPDLSIASVFPSSASTDSWLITVNLANNGYAAAEVPVTVRSATTSITQRVLIPARGKVSRRILIQGKPTQVQLNDGTVPETQASVHVTDLSETAQR
ncbi:MAG TPA: hypothetical protein VLZ50_01340 [Terracidiphilus sp.]|nr:hypothetical protein [Terracidiphilus sp.]